jgi:hypothetical protein
MPKATLAAHAHACRDGEVGTFPCCRKAGCGARDCRTEPPPDRLCSPRMSRAAANGSTGLYDRAQDVRHIVKRVISLPDACTARADGPMQRATMQQRDSLKAHVRLGNATPCEHCEKIVVLWRCCREEVKSSRASANMPRQRAKPHLKAPGGQDAGWNERCQPTHAELALGRDGGRLRAGSALLTYQAEALEKESERCKGGV